MAKGGFFYYGSGSQMSRKVVSRCTFEIKELIAYIIRASNESDGYISISVKDGQRFSSFAMSKNKLLMLQWIARTIQKLKMSLKYR